MPHCIRWPFIAIGLFLLILQRNVRAEDNDAWLLKALSRSPAWKRVKSTAPKPFYMIDGKGRGWCDVYVGEEHETHTVRWDTLRVFRSGRIMKWSFERDKWIPERTSRWFLAPDFSL